MQLLLQHQKPLSYQDFLFYFAGFSHAHAAVSPDEPIPPIVGIYFLDITYNGKKYEHSFYHHGEKPSTPLVIDNQQITLIWASEDQQTIKLLMEPVKK